MSESRGNTSPSNEREIDPELDIRSESFNPLRALLSSDTPIPVEDAPQFNNVAHYESAMKQQKTNTSTRATNAAPKVPVKSYREEIELHTRRFQPHQEMVKGTGKRARQRRNLLLKMSDVRLDGPTLALRQWKDQKHRVKIFLRNTTTITGYTIGVIEAFDKHWNIVLTDVFEVWKRKKFHHCTKAAITTATDDSDRLAMCMERLKMLKITLPAVSVKSISRKHVECSRNVPKLLIRGEQIATIILDRRDNESGNGNKNANTVQR